MNTNNKMNFFDNDYIFDYLFYKQKLLILIIYLININLDSIF